MIYGDIKYWDYEKGSFSPVIVEAIEYLKKTDFSCMENSRYDIDGNSVFVSVSETYTRLKSDVRLESHVKYIDIHYVISGQEIITFCLKNEKSQVAEDLLDVKDVLLYKDIENEFEVVLNPGMYAVFFPNDLHRPRCSNGEIGKVRKALIKVAVSTLEV